MSANDKAALLEVLAATAAALRMHEAGRAAARAHRIALVAQARGMGISHQRIADALDSSRVMSQYLAAQAEQHQQREEVHA